MTGGLLCPVCGAGRTRELVRVADVEYRTSEEEYEYRQCLVCGLLYLPAPPADRLAEIYPPNYYSHDPTGSFGILQRVKSRLDTRLFRRVLSRIPGANLSVLDVGGGSGWIASTVRRAESRVRRTVVVDLNPALREAAEQAGHEFFCSPAEAFRHPALFDLVVLLNLIEHVVEPGAVMANLARHLNAAGRILVKTPNTDTFDRRLFESSYWGGYHCPRHFRIFNRKNFELLAREAGLEVEEFRYTQGAPQWTSSLLAALERRGWISVTREVPLWEHPLVRPCLVLTAAFDYLRLPFAPTAQMFFVLRRRD